MKKHGMTRWLALFLIFVLLLTGCQSTSPEDATKAEPGEQTSSETETTTEAAQEIAFDELELEKLPVGDLAEYTPLEDGVEATEEDMERIQRAMRDYVPPEENLLINNAKHFYYYEQLNQEQQQVYDAMYLAAQNPSGKNYVSAIVSVDPRSSEFRTLANMAFWAMLYDHAELYWLYISRNICWRYPSYQTRAPYEVYFYVKEYDGFTTDMPFFNDAVKRFMEKIDLTKSEREIAKQIHDQLVDLVQYDYDLYYSGLGYNNIGHTAFGALVNNSSGKKNTCVCDGYAHAFVYLMQQAGLNACFISGVAGADETDVGGHAWALAEVDGRWYEVDPTWDDFNNKLVDPHNATSKWLSYYKEMSKDSKFMDMYQHHMFLISSSSMRNYKSTSSQKYYTKDGKWVFNMVGDSVHIRNYEYGRTEIWDALSKLTPVCP